MNRPRLPQIELKQFYYFLILSKHRSISAAANELGIAQPSLSTCISNLEDRLDLQLIARKSRGIQLTEGGEALAKYAAEVIERTSIALERIKELGTEIRGTVSLALPPSLSALLSVPLLETVHNEHPAVHLTLVEAMDGTVLDGLVSDQLDLGCLYEPQDANEFSSRPLLCEDIYLATAPDNWPGQIGKNGFAIEPINAALLQQLPLAMGRVTNGSRRMIERTLRKQGIRLDVISEIDSLLQMLEMVERASCYCLVPHKAVLSQLEAGTIALVPIVSPKIIQTTFLTRKVSRPSTRTSAYIEETIGIVLSDVIARRKLDITVF